MPEEEELIDQRNQATGKLQREDSQWPWMSYEAGVENALNWVLGFTADPPMDDTRDEESVAPQ